MVQEIGHLNATTKQYSGAIGQIQRGEADVTTVPSYYPLYDPEDQYFEYTSPISEDEMVITSAYELVLNGTETDIMDMFTSAPSELWWSTLAGFITFVAVLCFGYFILSVRKKYKSPLWMVTCAFLSEDNFPEDILFNRIITVTACSFIFFFGNYLMSSMSSDLVVFDNPIVITSYQDIMDRKASGKPMSIIMPEILPETRVFAEGIEGKYPKELFDMRKEISLEGMTVADLVTTLIDPMIKQESVAIVRQIIAEGGVAAGLRFGTLIGYPGFSNIRALFSRDPFRSKYANVMVMRKGVESEAKELILKL